VRLEGQGMMTSIIHLLGLDLSLFQLKADIFQEPCTLCQGLWCHGGGVNIRRLVGRAGLVQW